MSMPNDRVVDARITYPDIESHQAATTVFVYCGRCEQPLPNLTYASRDHLLVGLGLVAPFDLVLTRPHGWVWRDRAWRMTKYHREQRRRWELVAASPGHQRAAELQERLHTPYGFARKATTPPDVDAALANKAGYWVSAGIHCVLPTAIECPASDCGALNVLLVPGPP